MTHEQKRAFVDSSAWFHKINIGDGIITPGLEDMPGTLARVAIPDDLTGLSVLDIGANDGYYAFECERRGASRVVALDLWDRKYDNTRVIENIEFCKEVFNSNIEIVQSDFLDYDGGQFDVVLFMGVLYHLQDMMAGIRHVSELVKPDGLAILETHFIGDTGKPCAIMRPGAELNDDPTNWWSPNVPCVEAMLRTFFADVKETGRKEDRIALHAKGVINA